MKKIFTSLVITMLLMLSVTTIVSANENMPPVANAGGPYEGFTDENIIFNASGSYDPDGNNSNLTYLWEFGDASNSTDKIVNHSYNNFGVFTVNLTVTDEDGNISKDTTTATIKAKPIAEFTYSPEKPRLENEILFDSSGSTDPDGNDSNLTYEWNLGDGTNKTNQSFTHNYTNEGEYIVTLLVTDEEGYNDTVKKTISVVDNYPPKVKIIKPTESKVYILDLPVFKRVNGNVPLIVGGINIQANATDPDDGVEKVEFYINDELQETVNEPKKDSSTYQSRWKLWSTIDGESDYTIKVIAYDNHGETAENEIDVQHYKGLKNTIVIGAVAAAVGLSVSALQKLLGKGNETDDESPEEDIENQAPTAIINASSSVKVNQEITLDASESKDDGIIESYHWDLGDGTNISGETITHKYKQPGEYTVTLVVTDEGGEQDTMTMKINVEKTKDTSKGTPGFGITTFMIIITLFAAIAIYKKRH